MRAFDFFCRSIFLQNTKGDENDLLQHLSGKSFELTYNYSYIHTYTHTYIYIYIYYLLFVVCCLLLMFYDVYIYDVYIVFVVNHVYAYDCIFVNVVCVYILCL